MGVIGCASLAAAEFRRGDVTGDGSVDVSDPVRTLVFLFDGGAQDITCRDAADANDDGRLDLSDAITTLGFLFLGTATPPSPGPASCGPDPTADPLDCLAYSAACAGPAPPVRPTGLDAVPENGQVALDWDDNAEPDLAGYNVYRSTTPGAGHARQNGAPLAASAYVDTAVVNDTRYYYQVTAIAAGGAESARSIEASATPTAGPLDPSDVAPETPPGIVTAFADSVKFLHDGSGIQTGTAAGAIDPVRVAVLHGRVRTPAGDPVAMVRVAVLDHSEYGETLTRGDGRYDLAVNGGGTLTVELSKAGFVTVQRRSHPLPNRWEGIEETVLTPLDPQVTTVTLSGPPEMKVARGSLVDDGDGPRQATVLFPPGVAAEMVLPDGSTQPLTTLHVRATELTVGPTGPKAMPAPLPPSSGYTYCVELSVDEAIAAAASEVRFSEPLALHVDDFIGFRVGTAVPLGWYDRRAGAWVPAPDGRVIAVLGVTGDRAELDLDGDGAADAAPALAALGITDAERRTLAALYPGGGRLWRSRIPHFTPWDCNWPFGPPRGAGGPPGDDDDDDDDDDGGGGDPCKQSGSIIGCEDGTLGEVVPITGTPFRLVYGSERAPGRTAGRRARITLTGPELPETPPEEVVVRGGIAGQSFEERFVPVVPGLRFEYEWNGLDGWGRTVHGPEVLEGEVVFRYTPEYYGDEGVDGIKASFAQPGIGSAHTISGGRDQAWIEIASPFVILLAGSGPGGEIGGWTIDVQHVLDPGTGTVYLGSGGRKTSPARLQLVAGGGSDAIGDGNPALGVDMVAFRIAAAPDGSIYFMNRFGTNVVWRIATDGIVRMALGCAGGPCDFGAADGRLATSIRGIQIEDIDVGPDGRLHALLRTDQAGALSAVWRVEEDGTMYRVAGAVSGTPPAATPDGAPARETPMHLQRARVGPDGTVYLHEAAVVSAEQFYGVAPDGNLVHIAGIRAAPCPLNEKASHGLEAREACFKSRVRDFDIDGAGNVVVLGSSCLSRITPAGTFEHVAGDPACPVVKPFEPGGPISRDTCWNFVPQEIHFDPSGVPHVLFRNLGSSGSGIVRLDGAMHRVVGGGASSAMGIAPSLFRLQAHAGSISFTLLPGGEIAFAAKGSGNRGVLAKVSGAATPGSLVPAPDGRAAWIFDAVGRHLKTRDLLSGADLWSFTYDGGGRLASITDGGGATTTIARTDDKSTIVIEAPGGKATIVDVDGDGWIARIESPAGGEVEATYAGPGGLLETFTDELGNTSEFTWDGAGLLTGETGPLEGVSTLTRVSAGGSDKVLFNRGGRITTYETVREPDGTVVRTVTNDEGGASVFRRRPDGTTSMASPDGTSAEITLSPDPRFGGLLEYASAFEVKKGGRTYSATVSRAVSGGTGYFGSGKLTQTWTVNGKVTVLELDAAANALRTTTATGRIRDVAFDARGRATSVGFGPGAAAVTAAWGATGLLESASFGAFSRTFAYDARRRLVGVTDGAGRSQSATYDDDDRPLSVTDPAGRTAEFSWRPDGSLASFRIAGGAAHLIETTPYGALAAYLPPGNAQAYTRAHDAHGRLSSVTMPGGRTRQVLYDAAGLLTGIASAEATVTIDYSGLADLPAKISREPAAGSPQILEFTWEATLPTAIVLSGAVEGVISHTYGDDFLLTSCTLTSGGETVARALTFDDDGRVLSQGPVSFLRGGIDRAVSVASIGGATIAMGWTPEGLPANRSVTVGGIERYRVSLEYDAGGFLIGRTETAAGVARTFAYTPAPDGRLTRVVRNGVEVEAYTYDPRGNRTSAAHEGGAPVSSTYDGQDRLLSRGAIAYTVNADGYLAARGADSFAYSTVGELLSTTAGGASVTYDHDGLQRMVRRNGPEGATAFFYADPFDLFRPSAYRAPGEALTSLHYDDGGLLIALERSGSLWIVATDQVGSPRLVIDAATGATVKAIEYDSFGRVLSDSAPAFRLPIGFAGGIADPATGLVRFGLRDYDPAAGRWTARDPAFLGGGQLNLYEYVGSDPARLRDPWGLFCVGGSVYEGLGGGGKACYEPGKGVSICGEVGVGLGTSIDVSPFAGVDERFVGFEAGVKANVGNVVSFGCEGSYGINPDVIGDGNPCNNQQKFSPDCKAGAFGLDASLLKGWLDPGSRGLNTVNGDPKGVLDAKDALFKKPPKLFELQGKATTKVCATF